MTRTSTNCRSAAATAATRPSRAFQRNPSFSSLLKKYLNPAIQRRARRIAKRAGLLDLLPERQRRPDSAWILGAHLIINEKLLRRFTDFPGVFESAKTLLAVLQPEYDESLLEKLRLNPAYVDSYGLWQNAGARFELQARVLAGQSEAEIAQLFGTSTETIIGIERMFFRVRFRLDVPGFITHSVIRLHDRSASQEEAQRKEMLNMVYHSGPCCVDQLIAGTLSGRSHSPSTAAVTRRFIDDNRDLTVLKGAIALRMMDLGDPKTQIWLLKQVLSEMKGPKQSAKQRADDAEMEKRCKAGLEVFMERAPWRQRSPDSGASPSV